MAEFDTRAAAELAREAREERDAWKRAVKDTRAAYPESVFLPDSDSVDARSAGWARKVCDNIERRAEDYAEEARNAARRDLAEAEARGQRAKAEHRASWEDARERWAGQAEGLGRGGASTTGAMEAWTENAAFPAGMLFGALEDLGYRVDLPAPVAPSGTVDGAALREKLLLRLRGSASREDRTEAFRDGTICAYNDALSLIDEAMGKLSGRAEDSGGRS